jgi:hypothetical protein
MYNIGPTLAAKLTGLLIFFNQKKAMLKKKRISFSTTLIEDKHPNSAVPLPQSEVYK